MLFLPKLEALKARGLLGFKKKKNSCFKCVTLIVCSFLLYWSEAVSFLLKLKFDRFLGIVYFKEFLDFSS